MLKKIITLLKLSVLLLALLIIIYVVYRIRTAEAPVVQLTTNNVEAKIGFSPEQIKSIEDIGEWVFLTVEAEEMIDTVRKNLILKDDALSRIYVGNLHYGIDMRLLHGQQWLSVHGDTLTARVPAVKLLDRKFINEARTRTFYEHGTWDNQAMKALYQKAQRTMMKKYHTQPTVNKAKENALKELTNYFKAFGYNTIELQFD